MNKSLTLRGAQQHGQRDLPMLLNRMAEGDITTSHLATQAHDAFRAHIAERCYLRE